jgi:hypothetical protein
MPSTMNLALVVLELVPPSERIAPVGSGARARYGAAPVRGLVHSVNRVVVTLEFGLTSEGFSGASWPGALELAVEVNRANNHACVVCEIIWNTMGCFCSLEYQWSVMIVRSAVWRHTARILREAKFNNFLRTCV